MQFWQLCDTRMSSSQWLKGSHFHVFLYKSRKYEVAQKQNVALSGFHVLSEALLHLISETTGIHGGWHELVFVNEILGWYIFAAKQSSRQNVLNKSFFCIAVIISSSHIEMCHRVIQIKGLFEVVHLFVVLMFRGQKSENWQCLVCKLWIWDHRYKCYV